MTANTYNVRSPGSVLYLSIAEKSASPPLRLAALQIRQLLAFADNPIVAQDPHSASGTSSLVALLHRARGCGYSPMGGGKKVKTFLPSSDETFACPPPEQEHSRRTTEFPDLAPTCSIGKPVSGECLHRRLGRLGGLIGATLQRVGR